MRELKELRNEIDEIDRAIVELFEKRMEVAEEVAVYKINAGKGVLDPEREKEKLRSIGELTHSEFNRRGAVELFEQLMSMSRKRQYQMLAERGLTEEIPFREVEAIRKENVKTVFQGVPGAYAEIALRTFFGDQVQSSYVETWRDAMKEITEERADYAVLPFENSSAGIVSENYDLIAEYDVAIVGEQIIPIEHCLLATEGTEVSMVKRIYSHPQALMQCSRFLEEHRQIERISLKNTAAAAKKISEENRKDQAAIASSLTAELYGLQIVRKAIQNNESNSTRFFVIGKDRVFTKDAGRITISFEIPHESGSLYRSLSHFIFNGINLNRIESRPIQGKTWEYRFFIDIDGNLKDSAVQNALRGLNEETSRLKILGNY